MTGTTFAFTPNGSINSATAPESLTINAAGPVAFNAVIGNIKPLASLIVNGATGITLNHNITANGNISLASTISLTDSVTVTSDTAGDITMGDISGTHDLTLTTDGVGAKTTVGKIGTGDADHADPGQRVGNVVFNSGGVVVLNGDIYADSATFNSSHFNGDTPPSGPLLATIYHGRGSLIINTSGPFTMQKYQSLSVFAAPTGVTFFGTPTDSAGDLLIDTTNNHKQAGSDVTLGDISAEGSVTVDVGNKNINFVARSGEQFTQSGGGAISSPAVGVTSGLTAPKAINLTGKVVIIKQDTKSLNEVFFSSGAATVDIATKVGLSLGDVTKILDFNRTDRISGNKFFTGTTDPEVVSQVPSGIGLPPQNQVNVVPRDIQTLQPERAAAIAGALKDALQDLGIFARDMRNDELIEFLVGTALYDDVPYKLNPTPQDTVVAANRLPYAPVLPTVDAYERLFFKPELDANGKPILDANGHLPRDKNGKPKGTLQSTIILNTFGQTWGAYKIAMKDKATPDGFRAWLEANAGNNVKNAAALGYLDQLRDLLNQIHGLGLTDTEYNVSKTVLLAKVRPPSIKESDFVSAIMGPSTRAKTMTAMR